MFTARMALAAALSCGAVAASAASPTPDLAIKFGEREAFYGAALSPDGSKVTYITPITGRGTALMIADTTTGEVKPVMTTGDPKVTLRNCYWAKVDRIICRLYTVTDVLGSDLIGVTRLYSIAPDGKDIKEIGRKLGDRSLGINQDSGRVIDLLPDSPNDILMAVFNDEKETVGTNIRPKPPGLAVQRVNIRTGRMQMVEQPLRDGSELIADPTGAVRVRAIATIKETASYSANIGRDYKYFYRTKTSSQWLPLGRADLGANLTLNVEDFDETGDWLYIFKPKDGRQAIYKFAADGSNREELVYARQDTDIDGIYRIGKFNRPIGASYSTDYNHVEYFDTAIGTLAAKLKKALPGNPAVTVIDETWDGSKLFIYAGSDVDPGGYYIYDRTARKLGKLSSARPKLEGVTLASQKPVTFAARDGTQIPAYLTLPPGREDAKGLPAIVMPHGGPSSRDYWGFDWLPQYFAQLGYAVIQPNYRGSAGYGDGWFQENGLKSWRTAMNDVNDSVHWLVKQGIADPKRLAIVGWSYGGYSALQANVVEPDLYKAAIAIAPLTDMQKWRDQFRNFTNFRLTSDFIGSGPHIVEGSPAKNAAAIKAPVLMFHGTHDLNVNIEQSKTMESALRAAGKHVQLVIYPDLDHSLIDSAVDADMLLKSARFLEANLK